MTGERETVSVVIPTKNAAHLLEDCLASVAWADELIVVDMFSTDETESVCRRYPQCRLLQREDYIFGNVNFGFDQATSDWLMRLDTDERITPELADEIREILRRPPEGVAGFEFWERPFMLGRELCHGFGRKHFRKMLFRHGSARHPVQHEHESLETSGTWLRARNGYIHLNYPTVADYLRKTNYYTAKDVERADIPAEAPSIGAGLVDTIRPMYLYYLKLQGFRDGWVGFLDAGMRSVYQFTYWAKLRERWERERRDFGRG